MKKKIATRPLSGFDELDAAGIGAGYRGMAFEQEPEPEAKMEPKGRTWGEAATDLGAGALQGALGVARLGARIGDAFTHRQGDENPAIKFLNEYGDAVDMQKSEKLREEEQKSQQAVAAAGQRATERFGDGVGGKVARFGAEFGTGAYEAVSNPTLLANSLAEQIPMMGAMKAGQKAAELFAKGATRVAPGAMATSVGKRIAGNAGLGGAVATGMALQGSDVKGETYKRMMELPLDMWRQNPEFVALSKSIGEDAAKIEIAGRESSTAGLQSAGTSLATSFLPGGTAMERALVGGKKIPIAAVPQAIAGEFAQEGTEEGTGRLAGNNAVSKINTEQDMLDGVGGAAGQGGAVGGILGGGSTLTRVGLQNYGNKQTPVDPAIAAAQALADQQAATRKAAVVAAHAAAATPNSPIARAAAAANPLTPEEAWAKAQELAAQKAQDDELNAQAEAALAKMAQRKQQTRPVNEVVSDGGYLHEGTQDGDVLNGLGKPFSIKMGALQEAKRQARDNGGDWTVAPVFDGYVARKSATNKAVEPVESAQAATKNVAGDEVERYQWQRNAEGGQKRGNQQTIQPLTEALFNEYIAQKVSAKSFSDYKQQFPAATHISLVQKSDGSVELGAGGVGPIDHLRPKAAPVEKGWVKAVDSFDSPEAIAHASAADSGALSEIDQAAHEAATSPLNDKPQPTDGQKEAGNYAKGHITVHGMDMAIENPKGSTRSGVSPDGTAWSNTMGGHYGYFKGTLGNDGDHVDGYVGPNPESNRVFVIDQVNKDGSFDEHKAMIGYDSPEQAREAYMSSFMPGWTGLGAMTELPVSAFKSWVADGVKKKPLGDISRPQPAEPVSQPQEQASEKAAKAEQESAKPEAAAGNSAVHDSGADQPAAEQAGAGKAEVDLSTVAGVARAVQLKVASNRRKSREKSRREREKQGFSPNSTPESEKADYEAEISGSPSELQKKSAAAMLGTDPVPLIGMFVNGNFEASEDVFKDITGVKIRGLSAKDKKAALYQWAKWTPEQIAQAEGESQARAEAAADKRMQDDFNSAVTGAWLGLDRLKVNLKSGDTITGQDFILQSVAGGFDKAHSQKKGAAVIYGLTDGSRFTTLKAQEFTKFVKASIAFGGLDKALAYVNPPKPQAPEGFVDRSIDTADSRKADPAPVEPAPQAEPATPAPESDALVGFDPVAFDKERDDRIKASREAGNVHLDKVPPYVESMRGKQIYYAHDPKITGTIRTVDNRGTVYVNWNDAYSAEKELASPTQDGKKTVMQSGLGTSDLKDYVVGKPMAPAAEGSAPSKESAPRPKNWDKNYGAASKIAEALGIALRGSNGKMKKVPELVADIKALDVGGKPSPDGDGQHDELDSEMRAYEERATRIESTLANGGHVVGDQLRSNNGMGLMKLTPAELTRIPENKVREKPDPEKARVDTVKNQPKIDTSAEPVQKPAESGQVDAPQIEWTRTRNVDRMGIALKAGFKESVAESLSKRSWSSLDVVVQEKLAEAMAEPQEKPSEPPPAPTGEDALYTSTAKLTQPYTMDDFIGNVDAGYRAHFDYAGADGRTLWIEHLADGGWVLKSKDDDSASTYTKGGVGYGGRWNKAEAMRNAQEDAKYRFTEWKPIAGVMFQSSGEKAAITAGFKYLTNDHTWVKTVRVGEKHSELFNIREFGPEDDRSYRATKATSFPGTGATGSPSVDMGTFKTLDAAVQATGKASNFQSSSPAVQDFIDGKRDDAPTIEEVKAEKPATVTLPATVSGAIEDQLRKQKRRLMRLKTEASKDGMTLAEKVSAQTKHSEAESELRKMRTTLFDAEDAAVKALASGNPEDFAAHKELFPDAFAEISKLTAKPELSPLIKAMNFLMELEARQAANGMIGDDRLETKIRQQKAVVKELQDAANKPADTPSQEPSNTVKSPAIEAEPIDAEDRAVLDAAKAKIEELDSKIERHEALLDCLK